MHTLIVNAHPEPTSFCSSLARTAHDTLTARGHSAIVSDLYRDGFDPAGGPGDFTERAYADRFGYQREQIAASRNGTFAPPLAREIERVKNADLVILHFPLWWFGLPAMMKGWVDRVFAMGFAYGPGQSHATGPLKGKRAMLTFTTGSPAVAFGADAPNGDMNALLFPIQYGMLHFVGMDVLPPFIAYGAARVDEAARLAYLDRYTAHLSALDQAEPLRLTPAHPERTG